MAVSTTSNVFSCCCYSSTTSVRPIMVVGLVTLLVLGLGANLADSSPTSERYASIRIQQCREGCLEKFAIKDSLCQQRPECSTCWDECAKPPPPKINKSIRETWALRTVSMLQQDSLVLVDVAWTPLNTPNQCLVTWEVSGGGLMGNLLTESFNVQLSLWPDTKYRVQVTCKNKITGAMSRSLPLTIDTAEAITSQERNQQQQQKQFSTSTLLPSSSSSSLSSSSSSLSPSSSSPSSSSSLSASSSPSSSSSASSASSSKSQLNTIAMQDTIPAPAVAAGVPFDDESVESINQHTNFIFNWHTKNSDISKIEPITKPDLNILTIAVLSDMQKPLLFGVIAGTLLLAVILFLYVCMLRSQRVPSDKAALIEDDTSSVIVSMPPSSTSLFGSSSSSSSASASRSAPKKNSLTSSSFSSSAYGTRQTDDICKNPTTCSRNALKV